MSLTDREREAIDLLSDHPRWTNKEIGARMGVSATRVKQLLSRVYAVYGTANRTEAAMRHLAARRRSRATGEQAETLGLA